MPWPKMQFPYPIRTQRYQKLSTEADEKNATHQDHDDEIQRRRWFIHVLRSAAIFLVLTLLISSIGFLLARKHRHLHATYPNLRAAEEHIHFLEARPWNYSNPSPCGDTPETAREAGCRWSAMTFAWYPSACYDEDLDKDFLSVQPWEWFASEDLNPNGRLPRDAILEGDIRVAYMTMEYHRLHCMYTVRKLYRALFGMALSDTYILTVGHLRHCENFVMRTDHPAVKGVAKYLDCVDLSK